MSHKVGIIGLDGLSRKYLMKLLNNGLMAYTKHIINNAKINIDLEAFPPTTPASWPTIMTGVNPAKHGLYDFIYYDKSKRQIHITDSLYLEHPRIHEMLSYIGIKSVVINPVPSFPIIPVKNAMIFSIEFFSPKIMIYPTKARNKYEKYCKNISMRHGTFEETVNSSIKNLEHYIELTEKIFMNEDFQLFWINLHYPDIILHVADKDGLYDIFERTHENEDKLWLKIDKLIRYVGENVDNLVIVSDHGFSLYRKNILLNDLLYKHGYVRPAKKGLISKVRGVRQVQLEALNLPRERVKELSIMDSKIARTIYENRVFKRLVKPIARFPLEIYRKFTGRRIKIVLSDIDEDSIAFGLTKSSFYGVYVNKTEYIEDIVKALASFSGIKKVARKEDLFSGPFMNRLPDIYVYPDFDNGYRIVVSHLYNRLIIEKWALDHHPLGIFIMKDFQKEADPRFILPNSIVAPLIMLYMGVPLPKSIDNKDLISKLSPYRRQINFTSKYLSMWRITKKATSIGIKLSYNG